MKFARIEADEAQAIRTGSPAGAARVDLSEYKGFIRDLADGQMGRINIDDGEKKYTIVNHVRLACYALDLEPVFFKSAPNQVLFDKVAMTPERKAELARQRVERNENLKNARNAKKSADAPANNGAPKNVAPAKTPVGATA